MITDKQLEEMFPLMRRAMSLDLPDIPENEHDAWEEHMKKSFPFSFMDTQELADFLSEQMK